MASRLDDATSPYLRAHAHQNVRWYPWGPEAFAAAARRDVPVFVSIGYATCHWCHVMSAESFDDESTAAVLNASFVAIKVDREEHPEVDAAFLAAASAFTPNLGWPLSVFTTPDARPFHAGTYWPARAGHGMPAFTDVLRAVDEAWRERRDGVEAAGAAIHDALRRAASAPTVAVTSAELDAAVNTVLADEDPVHRGFGTTGAKFPVPTLLRFLQTSVTGAPAAARALAAMRASDLFDDVDGGFFRYATRADWTEPHYERMLIDNAQLIDVALDAGDHDTVRRVAGFLAAVLQQPSGAFASAQDADSLVGDALTEGGYYLGDRSALAPPAIDDKVITGWNGLVIAALARAGSRLGERALVSLAERAALAVQESNDTPHGWVRASRDDIAGRARATEADLAQLSLGFSELALATGEAAWAVRARAVLAQAADLPRDEVLAALNIPASPEQSDGDEPSGASARALAEIALWSLGAGEAHRERAEALVTAHAAAALASPRAHGALLRAAALLDRAPRQVIVVGEGPVAAARAMPADVFAHITPAAARQFASAGFSLFAGKDAEGYAYVCRDFTCDLPVRVL